MTESRLRRLEELFVAGAELAEEEQSRWLEQVCAGEDPGLRAELEDLLRRDRQPRRFGSGGPALVERGPLDMPVDPVTIGPYQIVRKIGEGGFGIVYLAEQTVPVRRLVALKVQRHSLDGRAVIARFEVERRTLARMDHPAIARVLDAGETKDGRPYFVMEYVEGVSLTEYCERASLGRLERLKLFVVVCRAVEHAHRKGVIHRDLKPANLLVTLVDGAPVPKVIDFGIAKALAEDRDGMDAATRTGEFLGTPEYMSPEQADSMGLDVDTRSDVYSLGVVLYRILSGRLPFPTERLRSSGISEALRILREETPLPLSAAANDRSLRGDLEWIVRRAMEKDRDQRYSSAAALAADVERYLRGDAVEAGPPSALYRIRKLVRRHRLALGIAALVVGALSVGLLAALAQSERARRAEQSALRQSRVAQQVTDFLTRMLAAANPINMALSPSLTVAELVDQAERELEREGLEQGVEAGVRRTLGATDLGLGRHQSARVHLQRALALAESDAGALTESARTECRLLLAEAHALDGDPHSAETILLELESETESQPELRVRWLTSRGEIFATLSQFEAADATLAEALDLCRNHAPGDERLARALGSLAEIRSRRGKQKEAETLAREAVEVVQRAGRAEEHLMAAASGRLAAILRTKGDFAGAEAAWRESLRIDEKVLGSDHPAVHVWLANVAGAMADRGALEPAEEMLRQARRLLSDSLGDDHPTLTTVEDQHANVLQELDRLEEALPLRESVLDRQLRTFGEHSQEGASSLNNLGSLFRKMERHQEAQEVFERALAAFRSVYGPEHPLVAVTLHNLGRTLLDAGNFDVAERTLTEALALGQRVFPPDHLNLAIFTGNHGRALAALQRAADAEAELLTAYEKILATFGPVHARTRELCQALAGVYHALDRPEEAQSWQERASVPIER